MLVLGVMRLDHMTKQHDNGLSNHQLTLDFQNSRLPSETTINLHILYLILFPTSPSHNWRQQTLPPSHPISYSPSPNPQAK
jgi:hypothetical protein